MVEALIPLHSFCLMADGVFNTTDLDKMRTDINEINDSKALYYLHVHYQPDISILNIRIIVSICVIL